ncbi:MAG: hypothetical protein RRY79_07235 [Clostridia bacterium]
MRKLKFNAKLEKLNKKHIGNSSYKSSQINNKLAKIKNIEKIKKAKKKL